MLLRYTGPQPVTFVSLGIEVDSGGIFDIPDEQAAAFLTRGDIQTAPADQPPPDKTPRSKRTTKTMPEPTPPAGDGTTPAGPTPDPTDAP